MSAARERELKLSLPGAAEYSRLLADPLLRRSHEEEYEDHYFDTAGYLLARSGAMFRLRRARGLVLAFKLGGESPGEAGYFDALEVEAPLPLAALERARREPLLLLEAALPPAAALLERFGRVPLRHLGSTRASRHRVLAAPYPLEVDRVRYPDGSESWELEVETDDPGGARRWIAGELERLGIEAVPQRRTKLEVLIERMGGRGWLSRGGSGP